MTTISVRIPAGASVDAESFRDIVDLPVTLAWEPDGLLCLEFAGDLTDEQQTRIRIRAQARDPEAETLLVAAVAAMGTNDAFLRETAPTQADVARQVADLTRQMNALLRLVLQS